MRHWVRRCAASTAFAVVLASLPLTGLASPAISRAAPYCGAGMVGNPNTTTQCVNGTPGGPLAQPMHP
ncbi:MAG: hypothetical protein JWR32_6376, partial [Mycobacterium sp.]|nr:hypothetical protein [Mycobacterium sp.]